MRGGWLPALASGRRGLTLAVLLAIAQVLASAPEPLADGPRPTISTRTRLGDAWTPAAPWVDHRFTTLPFATHAGVSGTWVLTSRSLPLQLSVEREIADRFGLETLRTALEVWDGTDGSRFDVDVTYLVDDRMDARRRDGVNRVFLDRTSCEDRYLARAHLYPAEVETRGDHSVAWIEEVDIGICERLEPERLASVLRHEIAHIAGLGHLCDSGEDCWEPEMSEDNRCRVMAPASYGCQTATAGDRDGLVYLHPAVPRVTGPGRIGAAAAAARLVSPQVRTAMSLVVVDQDADPDLQHAAAALAAIRGEPLVVADTDCVSGADGDAINRAVVAGGDVTLVGDVSQGCASSLSTGWELPTTRLRSLVDVTRATVEALTADGTTRARTARRVLVVPRAVPTDPRVEFSALAAPVAAALGAPIVPVDPGGLDVTSRTLLDLAPNATVAIVLGGTPLVSSTVEEQLVERGLRIRRIHAPDRVRLAIAISRMRDAFGADPIGAVVTALEPHASSTAAAAVAAHRGTPLLPVSEARHRDLLDTLATRIDQAVIVAHPTEVTPDLAMTVSRLLD